MSDPVERSQPRLHVLHVIDGLGLGGAERMLVDLANATVAAGHRVSVCVTRDTTLLARDLDARIELLVLDRRRRFSVAPVRRLAAWVRAQHVDVLHVHMRSSAAFMVLLRVLGVVRVPIVFHDHYGTIETDRAVPLWFRLGHARLGHYIGVYDQLTAWAQRAGMPAAKTSTIPNGVDFARLRAPSTTRIRDELGIAPDVLIGVVVATVRRDKGLEVLVDALALARHRDRARIVVVGAEADPEYARELRARASARNVESALVWLGPRTDVPGILAGADFGLLSSHTESGPLVLLEYLTAGLPIIATRVGEIGRRLASLGVPGFVPPRDPNAFAIALDELLALSAEARAGRAAIGRPQIADWDIRSSVPRWYAIYRGAIDS